jgi:predicted RNA-binding protein with RPS1 domain
MYPTNFPSKQQITEAFNRVASQVIKVKVLEVDRQGRIRLTMRDLVETA